MPCCFFYENLQDFAINFIRTFFTLIPWSGSKLNLPDTFLLLPTKTSSQQGAACRERNVVYGASVCMVFVLNQQYGRAYLFITAAQALRGKPWHLQCLWHSVVNAGDRNIEY